MYYREIKNRYEFELKAAKENYKIKEISELESDDLWSITKMVKSKRAEEIREFENIDGKKINDQNEIANLILDHFYDEQNENVNLNLSTSTTNLNNLTSISTIQQNQTTLNESFTITKEELLDTVKKFKNKKAPGYDHITNTTLKNLINNNPEYFTSIFNLAIKNGVFPKEWKRGGVIFFAKTKEEFK